MKLAEVAAVDQEVERFARTLANVDSCRATLLGLPQPGGWHKLSEREREEYREIIRGER